MFHKVKENNNLVRDTRSKAIINTNISEYEKAKLAAQRAQKNAQLAEDVESLKQDMEDIKSLLNSIAGKIHG